MSKPITEQAMEAALQYLVDTDEVAAAAIADVARCEYRAEALKDAAFLIVEGKNVEERKALSKQTAEYIGAMEKYFAALQKSNELKNKRATNAIIFEAWRSLNSNRRQGQ